ncbi:MAG: hypothetical protein HY017_22415 [Betaproteobacteria bacterium]|nr:hypothetical protein [Betaproteobacteria bacterium]
MHEFKFEPVRLPAAAEDPAGVSGKIHRVPWGDHCAHAVVVSERGEVGIVETAGAVVLVEKNLAGEPRASLDFESRPLAAIAPLAGAGADALWAMLTRL